MLGCGWCGREGAGAHSSGVMGSSDGELGLTWICVLPLSAYGEDEQEAALACGCLPSALPSVPDGRASQCGVGEGVPGALPSGSPTGPSGWHLDPAARAGLRGQQVCAPGQCALLPRRLPDDPIRGRVLPLLPPLLFSTGEGELSLQGRALSFPFSPISTLTLTPRTPAPGPDKTLQR